MFFLFVSTLYTFLLTVISNGIHFSPTPPNFPSEIHDVMFPSEFQEIPNNYWNIPIVLSASGTVISLANPELPVKLQILHGPTLEVLSPSYVKDQDKVVYLDRGGLSIELKPIQADVSTFEILKARSPFGRDKDKIFLRNHALDFLDVESFSEIDEDQRLYADKYGVYIFGMGTLVKTNYERDEVLSVNFDRYSTYIFSWNAAKFEATSIDNQAEARTFVEGHGWVPTLNYLDQQNDLYRDYNIPRYSRNELKVYFDGKELEGANANKFQILGEHFGTDGTRVFFGNKQIQEADPETFSGPLHRNRKACSSSYFSSDGNQLFFETRVVPNADPHTFRVLYDDVGIDKEHVYWRDILQEHISTTTINSECTYG